MVFSSLIFTFGFLPIMLLIYFISKNRYRNYILLIGSLGFYAYGEPKFILVLLSSILFNYVMAIFIDRLKRENRQNIAKKLLNLTIVINVGILFIYKYLDFTIIMLNEIAPINMTIKNIVLPIGISFFTFQALSYVIDVYRGKVKVQENLGYLMLYVSFFPQLIAGPIVRYSTIEKQILYREHTIAGLGEGCKRFLRGFSKKILLANNLSVVSTDIFSISDVTTVNPLLLWIGAICYSLQIYYDFSGYSDMAIGLGKMFGFEFEENFNYPYISKTITEFWRRWHISLGQWFRDYLYFPLGGSRVSVIKCVFNLLVVWGFTGLWHGANYTFIAWGFGYFILLIMEKFLIKPEKRNCGFRFFWQIVTLLCINWGWVIFNSVTLVDGIRYCFAMIGGYKINFEVDLSIVRYIREYGIYIVFGIIASTPLLKIISKKLDLYKNTEYIKAIVSPIIYMFMFLWAVSFLILGAHNPFIYFNF